MIQRLPRAAFGWLALLLCLALPHAAHAGDKLRKLKDDARRIQAGTVLVAPVLPDSFVLRKLSPEKQAAYTTQLAEATTQMAAAMQKHYTFGKFKVLSATDYVSLRTALQPYAGGKYFVLQFGHMAQFMGAKTKKASNYDKAFLGVYEQDATTRLYLGTGKVEAAHKPAYAAAIVQSMQRGLAKYAREKGEKGPVLLAPSLRDQVAVLPQERLFGNDSLTFLDGAYQTVVTTAPVRLYRAFGGVAMPGGTFVSPDSIADTAATRRDLAILMAWGNTLEFEAVIAVPVATKMNVGRAAPQGPLAGGGEQVILPYKWPQDWIVRIYSLRSAKSWTLAEFKAAYPQYFP